MSVLEAEGIVAGYGPATVLHGASVRIDAGEAVTILGPNGAGKSTLLKVIIGMLPAREGRVLLGGKDLAGLPTHEIVRRGVGYVPQLGNVFPNLTVRENLEMGAFTRPEGLGSDRLEAVLQLFPALRPRLRDPCGRLSGGQRQMVAMGRALVSQPRVLLLDEPSAGLAPTLQQAVFEAIRGIADHAAPVILVEQNARRALAVSDRGYVLDMGRNRAEGPADDLLERADIARLYLGGSPTGAGSPGPS